ncbi:MAG: SpoIIE family protein phosphatase [Leptospirales bacterium]|nr:SpoIIE family protein phosphatase [Leptospirales bacterium]
MLVVAFCIVGVNCSQQSVRPQIEKLESGTPESPTASWRMLTTEVPNLGYSRSVWIRMPVENTQNQKSNQVLEVEAPWLDQVDFFLHDLSDPRRAGLLRPRDPTVVRHHRNPTFEFSLEPGQKTFLYIRAETSGLLTLPVQLWTTERFADKVQGEYALHGIYFGTIGAMLIYNLAVLVFLRDKSYLYYCIHLLAILIFYLALGGFLAQYVPMSIPFIKPAMLASSLLSLFAVCIFNRNFLESWRFSKWLDRIVRGLGWICALSILVSVLLPYGIGVRIPNLLSALVGIALIANAIMAFLRGVDQSKYFLIAWLALAVGVVFEFATKFGFIEVTPAGRFGVQLGTLLEAILFSIALGRRIRSLSIERASSQERLGKIEREMDLARSIQKRILPQSTPEIAGANIGVKYLPLGAVGGDFYDFIKLDADRFGVFVADVTGHGVSAAMDSSTVKMAFLNEAEAASRPEELLANMNRFLRDFLDFRFVSAAYAYINLKTMEMVFAAAGHPPILLVRDKKCTMLESEGSLLGMVSGAVFQNKRIELRPGDRLIFYTDGLYERPDGQTELNQLCKVAESIAHMDLLAFCNRLPELMARGVALDDITLVVLDLKDRQNSPS